MVTKRDGPCYHAGVDTIDGFCYSWHKKLTKEELDRVYDDFLVKEQGKSDKAYKKKSILTQEELDRVDADFLVKEQGKSDPVQQDEKDLQAIDRV